MIHICINLLPRHTYASIHTLLARPHGDFQSQCYITNEHKVVKNPNWQEAEQLAIYKTCPGYLSRYYSGGGGNLWLVYVITHTFHAF